MDGIAQPEVSYRGIRVGRVVTRVVLIGFTGVPSLLSFTTDGAQFLLYRAASVLSDGSVVDPTAVYRLGQSLGMPSRLRPAASTGSEGSEPRRLADSSTLLDTSEPCPDREGSWAGRSAPPVLAEADRVIP
jgi:hypothetical protein